MAEHKHRDDLTGEHRLGDAGQIVLAILFGLIWVLDSFVLHRTTFLNDIVPLWIKVPLAVVLLVLAANLARAGLSIVFGERREIPGVIREGVFGWVRHPIYLGEILLYAGFLMLSLSIAAMVIWLAGIVFLHTISRYEERLLLARFGEEYAHYMREVPMWIPRLRSR